MNYETSIGTGGPASFENDQANYGQGSYGAADRGPSRRKWWIGGALIVLAIAAVAVVKNRSATDATATDKAAQAQTVSFVVPGRTTVSRKITASGVLAARRNMPVGIAGEGGKVVSVLVDAGTWVHAGQVLAVVDRSVQAEQIAGQAANIEVQRANARLAQANLDRALKLVSNGFISKADVDRLTATRDSANAQTRVAEATLNQLRASTARLNIVAPADGLVLSRGVEPGQIVGAGSGVLFQIAKDGEMEMQAKVAESDLSQMAVGIPVDVVPVGTTKAFHGQVWQLSPTIDPQSRQGLARVALAYDAALRPGGFATATIGAGAITAPVLPESAILSDAKGSYVYVVGSKNKAVRRDVTTGDVTEKGIAVISGVAGNEHIVLRAGGFLNPGDRLNPIIAQVDKIN
ncbi:efflux RND transporter periplasmic adaptor subunit [Novosphingobium sp.]|uniref:efflux RND transporter periplasmic adaptor subunit n=1 Tax=Novosphingobium sp. TaxID=1874826 RepID=UPI0025F69465|nr:efflux RND transporter periplasmic adaptor subunit [Novosphingobium sp.]